MNTLGHFWGPDWIGNLGLLRQSLCFAGCCRRRSSCLISANDGSCCVCVRARALIANTSCQSRWLLTSDECKRTSHESIVHTNNFRVVFCFFLSFFLALIMLIRFPIVDPTAFVHLSFFFGDKYLIILINGAFYYAQLKNGAPRTI